jgi:hypothetical protein
MITTYKGQRYTRGNEQPYMRAPMDSDRRVGQQLCRVRRDVCRENYDRCSEASPLAEQALQAV